MHARCTRPTKNQMTATMRKAPRIYVIRYTGVVCARRSRVNSFPLEHKHACHHFIRFDSFNCFVSQLNRIRSRADAPPSNYRY